MTDMDFGYRKNKALISRYIKGDCAADDYYDTLRLQGFTESEADEFLRARRAELNPPDYNCPDAQIRFGGQP